jgi:hypothetical protein
VPADIHLLPHDGCVHRPVIIGERRFLGLFCPEESLLLNMIDRPNRCRLCGHPNPRHHVRYRIRWHLGEQQVQNLARLAQCPRCHHKRQDQILIEVQKLRGTGESEHYTLKEFAALLKSSNWSEMQFEYKGRRRKGDTPHPLRSR